MHHARRFCRFSCRSVLPRTNPALRHRVRRAGLSDRAASSLPLIADADHGYGNALNVMRTVSELETAGVAALTIEDTALPKEFRVPKSHLIPLDEAVGKLRAAVASRQDPQLVLLGKIG